MARSAKRWDHGIRRIKRQEAPRAKTAARGYDGRWQKFREQFLKANPFCVGQEYITWYGFSW